VAPRLAARRSVTDPVTVVPAMVRPVMVVRHNAAATVKVHHSRAAAERPVVHPVRLRMRDPVHEIAATLRNNCFFAGT